MRCSLRQLHGTFEPGDVDIRDDDPELCSELDREEVLGGAAEEHR